MRRMVRRWIRGWLQAWVPSGSGDYVDAQLQAAGGWGWHTWLRISTPSLDDVSRCLDNVNSSLHIRIATEDQERNVSRRFSSKRQDTESLRPWKGWRTSDQKGIPRQLRRQDLIRGRHTYIRGEEMEIRRRLRVRRREAQLRNMEETRRMILEQEANTEAVPRFLRTTKKGLGKGPEEDKDYSLYAQYVARVEQLPTKSAVGLTEYKRVYRTEFDKWSRKRQVLELRKIGLGVDSADEATKLFVKRDEGMYPTTYTKVEVPNIKPKHLTTADLLHHQYHVREKIGKLYKRKRELKREARLMLRTRRREMEDGMKADG